MTADRPLYYESTRAEASKRWEQLESDPGLAGPWWQLFRQVQSPGHVLSELLQNADDAGATEAGVRIENGEFIFEHNGQDFTKDHFASLCNFGYSNKRVLHTIGFRGIGFKSTFSLGDSVELTSPTLAVRFHRTRFTEPQWMDDGTPRGRLTTVRVRIKDESREAAIQSNLEEWAQSPVSLLFFRNLRTLAVGNRSLRWSSLGPGPVAGTERVQLEGANTAPRLLICSAPEAFSPEALQEIREERGLNDSEVADFPPCGVQLALGVEGRLHVVLPAGGTMDLPFAANAPFIQDPARLRIKDPSTSPTNSWLLRRIGRLAAATILDWLSDSSRTTKDRADAYDLLPEITGSNSGFESSCAAIVVAECKRSLASGALLLARDGSVLPSGRCVIVPEALLTVWNEDEVTELLDAADRRVLAPEISRPNQQKLVSAGHVERTSRQAVASGLQGLTVPKPATWEQLYSLWEYVAAEFGDRSAGDLIQHLRLFPVAGKRSLFASTEVTRLGEPKLLRGEADAALFSKYLLVVDRGWPQFLEEKSGPPPKNGAEVTGPTRVLSQTRLDRTLNSSRLIERLAAAMLESSQKPVSDWVQLAHIAAHLDARVDESFSFVARDLKPRAAHQLFAPSVSDAVEELIPPFRRDEELLHADYFAAPASCSVEEWREWMQSERVAFKQCWQPTRTTKQCLGRRKAVEIASARGERKPLAWPGSSDEFLLYDFDFEEKLWDHWAALARADSKVWFRVVSILIPQGAHLLDQNSKATIKELSATGREQELQGLALAPNWALRFRDVPCLPDEKGVLRKPGELHRRTSETEPMLTFEPFVRRDLDREANAKLLDLLGVQSTASSPTRLLEPLRALARAKDVPAPEVDKWYRRIDEMLNGCSEENQQEFVLAFREERIILAESGRWLNRGEVFVWQDPEDVPGAEFIRPSVRDLVLWMRVEVPLKATAEALMRWLLSLPLGEKLPKADADRVRALLPRHPERIWSECKRWLNLGGQWVETKLLKFSVGPRERSRWDHLFASFLEQTADFSSLLSDTLKKNPFAGIPRLLDVVEDRFEHDPHSPTEGEWKAWLTSFAATMSRLEAIDRGDVDRLRESSKRLGATRWRDARGIEVTPYIDGEPAGLPKEVEVIWANTDLFVDSTLSNARRAKLVPEALGSEFGSDEIGRALASCYDREPSYVEDYLQENFELAPAHDARVRPDARSEATEKDSATGSGSLGDSGIGGSPNVGTEDSEERELDGAEHDCREDWDEHDDDADAEGEWVRSGPPGGRGHGARGVRGPQSERGHGTGARSVTHDVVDSRSHVGTPPVNPRQSEPLPSARTTESIMERFAKSRGFTAAQSDLFKHPGGDSIARVVGVFPWERRSKTGQTITYYWPRDHCLMEHPLELPTEVWRLVEHRPDLHAFVLADPTGAPLEMSGHGLKTMREAGKLSIHPASYRLVLRESQTNAEDPS